MPDTVKLEMDEMLERFRFLGSKLGQAALSAMLISAQKMVRDVVRLRMMGPRGAPGILGIVTGTARRSMSDTAGVEGDQVFAGLGSPLEYVRVHEAGFSGLQRVRAHDRRRLGSILFVSTAQATRGKVIKRARQTAAQRRAGPIHVRAHTRKVDIKAKYFIRDTVREAAGPIQDRIVRAVLITASTGNVPTPSQLGA